MLLPMWQGSEGEINYLWVGFADNKYSREKFGDDVGKQLSFYSRADFGSMSLNSILFKAGGIEAHANNVEGTVAKIERELDENIIYHMPLNAMKEGRLEEEVSRLAEPDGFLDPQEIKALGTNLAWLKKTTTLTPDALESSIKEAMKAAATKPNKRK